MNKYIFPDINYVIINNNNVNYNFYIKKKIIMIIK